MQAQNAKKRTTYGAGSPSISVREKEGSGTSPLNSVSDGNMCPTENYTQQQQQQQQKQQQQPPKYLRTAHKPVFSLKILIFQKNSDF